jgi:alkylhydroperoxidase/carboxymuconolactone decarboxylase family protein YurZ
MIKTNNNNYNNEETIVIKEEKKLFEKIQKEQGSVSKALKLMGKRSGAISAFMSYRNQLLNKGPLSNKERSLIMLATTVALKSAHCIITQAKNAKNAGASEGEIIQLMLIVGLVTGNQPLNTGFESIYEDSSN